MADDKLYCFGGNDVTLFYYLRCGDCGTVILVDHHMPESLEKINCPTCYPSSDFPFNSFTVEQLRGDRKLGFLVGRKATLSLREEGYI